MRASIDRRRLVTGAGCAVVSAATLVGRSATAADTVPAAASGASASVPADAPAPYDRAFLERMGRYRHYFAEPENGVAGVIANAVENGQGTGWQQSQS